MRIAIGGFQHESHSFAPRPATWADFLAPGGAPPLQRPATMLEVIRPTSFPAAGAIRAAEARGIAVAPLSWATTGPSGPLTPEAFERMAALLLHDLQDAMAQGPLDAIYLELHGAMVAEGFGDAEGELLRRFRAVAGDIPIGASLDPHANLTAAMVAHSDILVPYRTYPHVDGAECGARTVELLLRRIARGAPFAKSFRQADYWTPITGQCTLVSPMADVMAERARLEAAVPGVVELGFCFGFPYADFADCGMAVAAYAESQETADTAAEDFLADLARREADFVPDLLDAAEAVATAIRLSREINGPVVIADTQDNPGGGGHGDTTGLLRELVRQDARDATVALINDAGSAAALHAAGEGATVTLALGGKTDGAPAEVTGVVTRLSDGRFTCTGPMAKGNRVDLGPSALLAVGGVKVIVTSRKMQALDQMLIRHFGIDPARERILALKSSVHFRADFQPIAGRVLVAVAPGPVVADPSTLPFRHIRPGVRLKPGANAVTG